MLDKFKRSLFLKKLAGLDLQISAVKGFRQLSEIESACLILDIQNEESLLRAATLKEFWKKDVKNLFVVACSKTAIKPTLRDDAKKICDLIVEKKSFNWFGMPREEVIKKITEHEFDILISHRSRPNDMTDNLIRIIPAPFKTGKKSEGEELFDFSVETNFQNEELFLAEQIKFYLRTIKSSR